MRLSDVRLLVKDFDKCLKFYTEKLGFERLFNTDGFEGLKVSDGDVYLGGAYLSIFESNAMAAVVGNADKNLPTTDFREKTEIAFSVECVDTVYKALRAKGVEFINEPMDKPDWGIRCVHFRDPEGNLLSLVNGGKDSAIKLDSAGLLINDFPKSVKFYIEKLGLETTWNDDKCYASFNVADGITGLSLFSSDLNAEAVGNVNKVQPTDCREKLLIALGVECVDTVYEALKAKGVEFINQPFDWEAAYMRAVHLRDPEGNLIEFHAGIAE